MKGAAKGALKGVVDTVAAVVPGAAIIVNAVKGAMEGDQNEKPKLSDEGLQKIVTEFQRDIQNGKRVPYGPPDERLPQGSIHDSINRINGSLAGFNPTLGRPSSQTVVNVGKGGIVMSADTARSMGLLNTAQRAAGSSGGSPSSPSAGAAMRGPSQNHRG